MLVLTKWLFFFTKGWLFLVHPQLIVELCFFCFGNGVRWQNCWVVWLFQWKSLWATSMLQMISHCRWSDPLPEWHGGSWWGSWWWGGCNGHRDHYQGHPCQGRDGNLHHWVSPKAHHSQGNDDNQQFHGFQQRFFLLKWQTPIIFLAKKKSTISLFLKYMCSTGVH